MQGVTATLSTEAFHWALMEHMLLDANERKAGSPAQGEIGDRVPLTSIPS